MSLSQKIKFDVSAKTARLIGRENISGVNGALLELIKNSYDADASFCAVYFYIPFPSINISYEQAIVNKILSKSDFNLFFRCFEIDDKTKKYKPRDLTSDEDKNLLIEILNKYNFIVVFDNGVGMDENIIKNSWMNIGTSDKEINIFSPKGRIKTGAKGIGRFSIDKLSKSTTMITKQKTSNPVKWTIDWTGFDNATKLSEISADLEVVQEQDFFSFVEEKLPSNLFDKIKASFNDSGTIIFMNPTREQWSTRLFSSLNTNLRSINPFQSTDVFNVYVQNEFYQEYCFEPEKIGIDSRNFDYHILSKYNGLDKISIKIKRNEFDTTLDKINVLLNDTSKETISVDSSLFWNRDELKNSRYSKNNYDKVQNFVFNPLDLLPSESFNEIKKVGPFEFEFFFLKSGDTVGFDIVKRINAKTRKRLLNVYSGIKIYRDNFKVRPYGDSDSNFYDWLLLNVRSQKSPAAVTKLDARWRVEPYQIIGNLKISRLNNPNLRDMANREGIEPNDYYGILKDLLVSIIDIFEFDRQFYYRQYALMRNELYNSSRSKEKKIIDHFVEKKETEGNDKEHNPFSKEDIEDALKYALNLDEGKLAEKELLMALGTSGILANTFSHELKALQTSFDTDISTIRKCIMTIIRENEYTGDEDLNPYIALKNKEQSERLLSAWIGILSNGIQEDSLKKSKINLCDVVDEISNLWEPLLKTKNIEIDCLKEKEKISVNLSRAEAYVIFNNFILNSAWFLEKVGNRQLKISLTTEGHYVLIRMENNGEPLHSDFVNDPYRIFELGQTSKYHKDENNKKKKIGTGLGLWLVYNVVKENGGSIIFHELSEPYKFGFTIKLQEVDKNDDK